MRAELELAVDLFEESTTESQQVGPVLSLVRRDLGPSSCFESGQEVPDEDPFRGPLRSVVRTCSRARRRTSSATASAMS